MSTTNTVTEQDRATARRVIRRVAGALADGPTHWHPFNRTVLRVEIGPQSFWSSSVTVLCDESTWDEAAQAAALGRQYHAALKAEGL
jgi:hypothetical protein